MPRRLGRTLARLVGLVFTMLGAWAFGANLIERGYSGSILLWILASGAFGCAGGVFYLLSFDGPARFRTRGVRVAGWIGMFALALLPWSFSFVMFPMVLLTVPTLLTRLREPETAERISTK